MPNDKTSPKLSPKPKPSTPTGSPADNFTSPTLSKKIDFLEEDLLKLSSDLDILKSTSTIHSGRLEEWTKSIIALEDGIRHLDREQGENIPITTLTLVKELEEKLRRTIKALLNLQKGKASLGFTAEDMDV